MLKFLPKFRYWHDNNYEIFIKDAPIRRPPQSNWFRYKDCMDVYLRSVYRKAVLTLDIANVSVEKGAQSKGIFKSFVNETFYLARESGYTKIYFENVINTKLNDKFRTMAMKDSEFWIKTDDYGEICSYYYLISNKKDIDF